LPADASAYPATGTAITPPIAAPVPTVAAPRKLRRVVVLLSLLNPINPLHVLVLFGLPVEIPAPAGGGF